MILEISWKVPPRTDTDELKRKMDLAIRANQNQAAEQKMGLNLSNCSRYLNEISFLLTLFERCCYDISHGLLTSRGLMTLRKWETHAHMVVSHKVGSLQTVSYFIILFYFNQDHNLQKAHHASSAHHNLPSSF